MAMSTTFETRWETTIVARSPKRAAARAASRSEAAVTTCETKKISPRAAEVETEALVQEVRDQRLEPEAARERVERTQRGEPVDERRRATGTTFRVPRAGRSGQAGVDRDLDGGREQEQREEGTVAVEEADDGGAERGRAVADEGVEAERRRSRLRGSRSDHHDLLDRQEGPVSPVPTATLPSIAAATTTHGARDARSRPAATMESAASRAAPRAARSARPVSGRPR
jgi:hypothetical protein